MRSAWWPQVPDLERRLGRDLEDRASHADDALDAAVELVQGKAEQLIEPVDDDTHTLPVSRWRARCSILLPEIPVRAVTAVTIGGVATNGWELDERAGRIDLDASTNAAIVITYDHGHTSLPGDLRNVVLQVASRHLDNPDGYTTQTYQGYSAQVRLYPGELSRTELAIVRRYARTPAVSATRDPRPNRVFPR